MQLGRPKGYIGEYKQENEEDEEDEDTDDIGRERASVDGDKANDAKEPPIHVKIICTVQEF